MTQIVLLGDVCLQITDGAHWSPKSVDDGYPMASVKDMLENRLNLGSCRKISKVDYEKLVKAGCRPEENDILIAKDGSWLKHMFVSDGVDNVVLLSSIAILKPNLKLVEPRYLAYYIRNQRDNYDLSQYVSGAAIPRIILKNFARMPIELPSLETQKKITDILGAIDEKIELNRRMNETLEQMGQALFRHYFIDNPEAEKWESGVVSDLITIYSGYAFKRTDFDPDGDYGLVTIKNVQDGNFVPECSDYLSTVLAKTPDYAFLKTGDILLSLTGNVGRVCIVRGENLLLNQRVAKLVGADGRQSFAYFMFRQEEFKNRLISMSRGTAQLNLSPIETKKLRMKLPPKELLSQYHEQAEPLFEAITANYTEIQTLTALRDTLLPRLINGKVKI